eukprot:TRINITY_DN3769_c0_g1_i2.p1 TRINITY_DN3769_c0_g1~~TRINITY_DN3769_c0_g1_i2.p1  ORF type:complete len:257 (+),score=4.98 TRINITY_DN3769_c0_g1_i2:243-1013(+)
MLSTEYVVASLNLFELIGFSGTTVFFVVFFTDIYMCETFTKTQYFGLNKDHERALNFSGLIVVWVFLVVDVVVLYFWVKEYRWEFWKRIGGDAYFQAIYQQYQIFKSTLKLDLMYSFISVALIFFFLESWQKGLSGVSLVLNIVTYIMGWSAVKFESRRIMILFFVVALISKPILVGLVVYWFFTKESNPVCATLQFLMIEVLDIIIRFVVILYGYLCIRNFGKGISGQEFTTLPPPSRSAISSEGESGNFLDSIS